MGWTSNPLRGFSAAAGSVSGQLAFTYQIEYYLVINAITRNVNYEKSILGVAIFRTGWLVLNAYIRITFFAPIFLTQ